MHIEGPERHLNLDRIRLIVQELLNHMYIKRLFEKVELRQVLVTMSNTRKIDLSMMSLDSPFCSSMHKKIHTKQRKNEQ